MNEVEKCRAEYRARKVAEANEDRAREIENLMERGPFEGEDFYRVQFTGNGKTPWINLTPDQLTAIAAVFRS